MTERDVSERSWGRYEIVYQGPTENGYLKVKRLILNPLSSTSKQRHKFRTEFFFPLLGEVKIRNEDWNDFAWPAYRITNSTTVPPGVWHQLINETEKPASLIEVQVGAVVEEDDIERAG